MRLNPTALKKHPQIRTSNSSTRGAGESIKPGVERSGTPGQSRTRNRAHGVGGSGLVRGLMSVDDLLDMVLTADSAIARFTGSELIYV